MSSSIFFRFKSRKDALQINFDGTSLSVFEVKREIMNISRLGDGKDFDLEILTSDSNEVYDDDTTQIPRSTTVIVKRTPASKPGAGRAARYVTGQMPIHAKNQHRIERGGASRNTAPTNSGPRDLSGMTEEERLQAVMNASNTQLKADLEMSATIPSKRNTYKPAAVPDKPLPPGYVCYRCRKKGHWIQACPTNSDPTFDGKKPKRTTGIPRSMLEKVDAPAEGEELPDGVFMNQDGDFVRVKTDDATWQKIQEQQKASAAKVKELAQNDQELIDRGLECTLDKRPFLEPVKTPCCKTTYCRDCIENALLDNDLLCPNCGEQALIDNLEPDDDTRKKLEQYQDEKKAEKQRKDNDASKSPAAAHDTKSPAANTEVKADSPSSQASNSKKRSAEDDLENKRRPSNPAEMNKIGAKHPTPAPPTGPKADRIPQQPKNMTEFANMMNAMAGSMAGGQNGMNAFVNPMMGGMPMMPGMGPMGMPPMMPGMMPNFNMINGMNNMNGMNAMGFPNMNGGMNGMGMNGGMGNGNMGWQNQNQNRNQQQPWMNGGGPRNGTPDQGQDGAYFRQPVNPHRHQNKQRRQRSIDYKQM